MTYFTLGSFSANHFPGRHFLSCIEWNWSVIFLVTWYAKYNMASDRHPQQRDGYIWITTNQVLESLSESVQRFTRQVCHCCTRPCSHDSLQLTFPSDRQTCTSSQPRPTDKRVPQHISPTSQIRKYCRWRWHCTHHQPWVNKIKLFQNRLKNKPKHPSFPNLHYPKYQIPGRLE